jgi:hypothetical protein
VKCVHYVTECTVCNAVAGLRSSALANGMELHVTTVHFIRNYNGRKLTAKHDAWSWCLEPNLGHKWKLWVLMRGVFKGQW